MPLSRRRSVALLLAVSVLALGMVTTAYRADLGRAHDRLRGRSAIVATRAGPIEYGTAGSGPPLLMIHGTGGGFDQGLLFSQRVAARGVRVIAPSRFGYLRSSWPAAPSSANQADALVDLLDHLGIAKVAVAGGSAGALSAVQFALRHPERTTALILLVPAANVDGQDPNPMPRAQAWLLRRLIRSDFLYWALRRTMPERLIGFLLATDPALLDTVTPDERARAFAILDQILPTSARWRGMINDADFAGRPARAAFGRIAVPVLVVSAEDDRFGTAATSRKIARAVPGARLIVYSRGGHILLGHDDEVGREVARFVHSHSA